MGPCKPEGAADITAQLVGFQNLKIAKGQLFSTPVEREDRVLLLEAGRMRVYMATEEKELTLAYLEPGDLFTTHTPTYLMAVSDCRLKVMPSHRFLLQMKDQPALVAPMMRVLGRLLNNSLELTADLAFRDVPARLIRFVLETAKRRGRVETEGTWLPIELNTKDIALLLGTSRQTLSALLNRLERDGVLLRPHRHQWLIPDAEALQRWPCGSIATLSAG